MDSYNFLFAIAGQINTRLQQAGVPLIGPIPVGAGTWSVYFFDPNGIRLEFSYRAGVGDDVYAVERSTQTRDGVMAELRSRSQDATWLDKVTAQLPSGREAA